MTDMEKPMLIDEIIRLQQKIACLHLSGRLVLDSWRQLDVPLAQLKSLLMITCQGGTSLRRLADDLGVTPGDVTGIVNRLVRQGLVTRRADPQDRRVSVLKATDAGRNLLASLRESGSSQIAMVLTRLSHEELAALAHGLTAFAQALKEINDDPATGE